MRVYNCLITLTLLFLSLHCGAQCPLKFEVSKVVSATQGSSDGSISIKTTGQGAFVVKLFKAERNQDVEVKSIQGNGTQTCKFTGLGSDVYWASIEIPGETNFNCRKRVIAEIEVKSK